MFLKLPNSAPTLAFVCLSGMAYAQHSSSAITPKVSGRPPNADGIYAALRTALPSGDGVQVKEFALERQGANFTFVRGAFYLYAPINGKVTGAVFVGDGHFDLSPLQAREQHSLSLLTKGGVMSQQFSTLLLRFTDDTAEEIRKASAGNAGAVTSQAIGIGTDSARSFRGKLHENVELRLLSDVLVPGPGEYFLASFRMGSVFTARNLLFEVDPEAAPDEVTLNTWSSDESRQIWAGYHMQSASENRGVPLHVIGQRLDVRFESSGAMRTSAETTIKVRREGLRVVELNLFSTLRVHGVFSESGDPLDFVQENKNDDPQFAVVLPKGATHGETLRLLIQYGGDDALIHDGEGMYYLLSSARESWYPGGNEVLGGFCDFHMTFHIPKNLQIVATGKFISQEAESGGYKRVVWETQNPIPVAGFNLGDFKTAEQKTPQGFDVQAFANVALPDSLKFAAGRSLGSLTTTAGLPDEVAQGSAAIQVYSDFFGKLPYDHVALTEQSACGFGQSWPMLVYLPICAFWDTTIQTRLGIRYMNESYWKDVTPHEVAHQWWGQEVGFSNYRDQWMSEGFANFSVSLYILATTNGRTDITDFWKEQKRNILEKNQFNIRPIDVGPLTMGYRVSNEKTGNIYQNLIYSKGAYVMHMLQLMYWTPDQGDKPFKHSMQEFVKEFAGKSATTEDLQASFERTMPKWVDLNHNGKLDWFFNEYVYGTELPHYDITSEVTTTDGESSLHFKVTQSNVSKDFLMMVPLYVQLADGNAVRLVNLTMQGDTVSDHVIKLGKIANPPKKAILNYNADVLSN